MTDFPEDQVNPSARVVLDSFSPMGARLTTMVVTFHRFVLAEFNTHRAFSRSSASSRAIPVEKQLDKVEQHPAYPVAWTSEQPGMQGGTELVGDDTFDARVLFEDLCEHTLDAIQNYLDRHPDKSTRLHKSLINRLLEPFMWHTVVVTSTDWDNFFKQRVSPLAQPEIKAAADLMLLAYTASKPKLIGFYDWHTPFIQDDEQDMPLYDRLRVSTARVARVSYLNHDGIRSIDDDLNLFNRLVSADPMHAAPLEMVATPSGLLEMPEGNFDSWHQLRHAPILKDLTPTKEQS